ncbi:melatonin receptor type 1A-like [Strongylocentrotus purpuratus]|uniref:G-protein coupled receptors family 1 profile domain-containing protein n=1 Tax=Strongylocentrotus purpuratus TaxID=7668 RepID=A0A7M7NWM1_STRPU|nr:melatonin receptor type 1A-like [Strongylocentrotus purpuratus]XP_030841830.1 melatonin receptor type 1A-like [Strongylocentrotus purpuratus]
MTQYHNPYSDQVVVHTIVQVWTTINAMIGTCGNIMIIAAVSLHHKLRNIGNVFIINLALADLGVSIVVNLASVVGSITNEAGFFFKHDWLCELVAVICIVTCSCSLWSIATIAFNRYVWICHWNNYHRIFNRRTVPLILLIVWGIAFLIDLPNILGWGVHEFDWKVMSCTGGMAFVHSYALFFASTTFVLPLFIITYSYVGIFRFSHRASAAIRRMQESASIAPGVSTVDHSRLTVRLPTHATKCGAARQLSTAHTAQNRFNRGALRGASASDLRLARSIFIIVIMYLVMWLPFSMTILFDTQKVANRNIYLFTFTLAHMNSSVNCVIYGATNQNFRRGYIRFLRFMMCKAKRFNPLTSTSMNMAVKRNGRVYPLSEGKDDTQQVIISA